MTNSAGRGGHEASGSSRRRRPFPAIPCCAPDDSMISRNGHPPVPKDCHRVWRTKQPDPRRGPMGLRRRDWRRPRPPPRMARTTRRGPATAGTRRTAAAAAAACPVGRRPACRSSAGGSGWSSSRGWHRQPRPSDGTRRPRGGCRAGSRPRPCAAPGSPGPRWARRGYPRSHRPRRSRTACRPSPAPAPRPVAANSRSETVSDGRTLVMFGFLRQNIYITSCDLLQR